MFCWIFKYPNKTVICKQKRLNAPVAHRPKYGVSTTMRLTVIASRHHRVIGAQLIMWQYNIERFKAESKICPHYAENYILYEREKIPVWKHPHMNAAGQLTICRNQRRIVIHIYLNVKLIGITDTNLIHVNKILKLCRLYIIFSNVCRQMCLKFSSYNWCPKGNCFCVHLLGAEFLPLDVRLLRMLW